MSPQLLIFKGLVLVSKSGYSVNSAIGYFSKWYYSNNRVDWIATTCDV